MSLMTWFRSLFSSTKAERPQAAVLGRNDLCWCGSGKKYKKCHLNKDEHKQREAKIAAQFAEQQRRQAGLVPSGTATSKKRKANLPEAKGPVADSRR